MATSQDKRFTRTRQRLVEATIDLIDQTGWGGVTLKAVAGACGISTPASYKHFPNKAALFDAAVMEVSTRLAASCEPFVDDDPRASLLGIGTVILKFASEHPRLWEFATFGPDNRADSAGARRPASASGPTHPHPHTHCDSTARGKPSQQAESLMTCWTDADAYPFLRLMHAQTARLVASQGHPPEAAGKLFVALWSFVQGYSSLIAHDAVAVDDGLFRASLAALITVNERI